VSNHVGQNCLNNLKELKRLKGLKRLKNRRSRGGNKVAAYITDP
jgi:hypothetical protein